MDINEQRRLNLNDNTQRANRNAYFRTRNGGQPFPTRGTADLQADPPQYLYDARTGLYCPEVDPNDNSDIGFMQKEMADKFVDDYIINGSPEARKPHLDRIFEDLMIKGAQVLPVNRTSQDTVDAAQQNTLDPNLKAQLCYVQNLFDDNPEYAASMDPKIKERALIYAQLMGVYSALNLQEQVANGLGTRDPNTPLPAAQVQDAQKNLVSSRISLEFASQYFAAASATLDGSSFVPVLNFDFKSKAGQPPTAFALKNPGKKPLTRNTPGHDVAVAEFSEKLDQIFVGKNSFHRSLGLNQFDLIFINGVSANEMYGAKYPKTMDNRQRDGHIQAEIMSAMLNGKARIDVTPVMMDQNGKYTPVALTLRPNVTEIQPRNRFGKSEQTKQAEAFDKNIVDPKINSKLNSSVHNIRLKLLALDMEAGDREIESLDALVAADKKGWLQEHAIKTTFPKMEKDYQGELQRMDAIITDAKQNPSPFVQDCHNFNSKIIADRNALGIAMYGEADYEGDMVTGRGQVKCPNANNHGIRLTRGGLNIGIAMLVGKGHSFEDILDPTKLLDEKKEVGDTLKKWVAEADPKTNPEKYADLTEKHLVQNKALKDSHEFELANAPEAQRAELLKVQQKEKDNQDRNQREEITTRERTELYEKITPVYSQFAEKYEKMQKLPINHTDTMQVTENYREIHGRGSVTHDIGQEFSRMRGHFVKTELYTDARTVELSKTLLTNSMPYSTIEEGMRSVSNLVTQTNTVTPPSFASTPGAQLTNLDEKHKAYQDSTLELGNIVARANAKINTPASIVANMQLAGNMINESNTPADHNYDRCRYLDESKGQAVNAGAIMRDDPPVLGKPSNAELTLGATLQGKPVLFVDTPTHNSLMKLDYDRAGIETMPLRFNLNQLQPQDMASNIKLRVVTTAQPVLEQK